VLNREQDFDLATPMLHHDSFVGRVAEALTLSEPEMIGSDNRSELGH
jgi:hypothetical protein